MSIYDPKSGFLLTWRFDVQPTRTFNLPAEKEVLQEGSVGAKYMGKCFPLEVRWQSWKFRLKVHVFMWT